MTTRRANTEPSGHIETGRLTASRGLALFLLSLCAVGHALLAWSAGRGIGPCALALVVALPLGERLTPQLQQRNLLQATRTSWWVYLRAILAVGYAAFLVIVLLALSTSPTPAVVRNAVLIFVWLQPAALLLSGLLGRAAVANALVLVGFTGLHGDVPAAASILCLLPVLGVFLVFDHALRTLASYPSAPVPPASALLQRALRVVLPPFAVLAIVFFLHPMAPAGKLAWQIHADNEVGMREISPAYRLLALLGLMGGASVWVISALLGRKRRRAAPAELEVIDVVRGGDEPLAPAAVRPVAYPGTRGAIVRAYVQLLARAARRGHRRHPSQTPGELARGLRVVSSPLPRLTERFLRARWGPDDPEPSEAAQAQSEAEAVAREIESQRL